uniref:Uncharacterized protein n=1 Tax=Parascaris equorum TaxID=6256 RepID=A0A914R2T5_PAREQ
MYASRIVITVGSIVRGSLNRSCSHIYTSQRQDGTSYLIAYVLPSSERDLYTFANPPSPISACSSKRSPPNTTFIPGSNRWILSSKIKIMVSAKYVTF